MKFKSMIRIKFNQAVRTYKLISKLKISTAGYGLQENKIGEIKRVNSYLRMTRIFLDKDKITIKIRRPENSLIKFDQANAIKTAKILNSDFMFSDDDGLDPDYIILEGSKK